MANQQQPEYTGMSIPTSSSASNNLHGRGGGKFFVSIGVPWRLLIMTSLIFGLVILFWAGLSFGYTPYLSSKISNVDAQLDSLSSTLANGQQKQFTTIYSQLYNIEKLATIHYDASKIFDFLEASTYQTVLLNNVSIDNKNGSMNIGGIALNYDTLADQIASYKRYPGVSRVVLQSSSKLSDQRGGGTTFSIKVFLSKGFFNSK